MNIVFVGLPGVPYLGRACDPRLTNIANLLEKKNRVTIVNRYSSLRRGSLSGGELLKGIQIIEVLKRRNTGRILTLLFFVLSVFAELLVLIRLQKKQPIHYLHLYTGHYLDLILYYLLSRIIGAKVVYEYVEYRTDKNKNRNLYHKINNKLFDTYGPLLWDSCIAISNFLEQKAKEINPKLPVMKVTPLCDFQLFDGNHLDVDIIEPYLMFCGSACYFDVVKFIIDSYKASTISKTKKLLLVLSGSDDEMQRIKDYDADCVIRQHLPYSELIAYYKHAFALLIPLRNTIEDIARFPNKICEYTAGHGLIVTTANGEIPYYFKNGHNAVVAKECTVESISNRLNEIEYGKYDIEKIREQSYLTGVQCFSIDAYSKLYRFFEQN